MEILLDSLKKWCLENLIDENTLGILLVGSAVKKSLEEVNDIDVLVIKEGLEKSFSREERKFESMLLDLNFVDTTELMQRLNGRARNFDDLNWTSVWLVLLRDSIVWYQRNEDLERYFQMVKNWTWDSTYKKYLDFEYKEPQGEWQKQAFIDHLKLISVLKQRLSTGRPVSHRRKDLPELRSICDEAKARSAFELTMKAYKNLQINWEIEEAIYAEKALKKGDWSSSLDNTKDVLKWLFLTRIPRPAPLKNHLDPNLWSVIEKKEIKIPKTLKHALKAVYSS